MMKTANPKAWLRFILESVLIYVSLLLMLSILLNDIAVHKTEKLLLLAVLIEITGYLHFKRKDYFICWFGLYALLLSVLFPYKAGNEAVQAPPVIKYMTAVGGLSCFLILLGILVTRPLLKKAVNAVLLLPVFIMTALFWGYYLSMNAWFGSDTLLAIMQTNLAESKEYLRDYLSLYGSISTIIILLVAALLWHSMQNLALHRENRFFTALILFIGLASAALCYKERHNIVFDIAYNAQSNLQKYADFQKKQLERKEKVSVALKTKNDTKGVFVVVIGESQNKGHMSAYGYNRKTTPWLENALQQDNFINFANAYSCHTHTVPVLTYALTAKNQYNNIPLANAVSILEAAEAAGFETAWVSNQVKYGAWDTPVTVIASEANQQIWINHNLGETAATNAYDIKLADCIDSLKITDKMLIVIHLMGNHSSYEERYPKSFAKFSGKTGIDKYDNSILYNDYVVSKLYERVQKLPDFQGMLYFADHADAVKEGLGHDAGKFVWPMTHIPMYMAFSDKFIAQKPDIITALRGSQNKYFTNDLIFNTVLGIMQIEIPGTYEKENDITSAQYNADVQRFKTLYGQKKLTEEVQ